MSVEFVGLIVILGMFLLMFLRVPVAISMVVPTFLGILYLREWRVLSSALQSLVWDNSFNYIMLTIPLFVLMGHLIYISGISSELFLTFKLWFGKLKGGLGIATIGSSSLFAAASGSSLATASTIGVIASKEMLGAGYNKPFTATTILAGGTLGMLIPPSTLLIMYGYLTGQSIGQLLMAAVLPGILLTFLYIVTVYVAVLINPKLAPMQNVDATWKERFVSLKSTSWIIVLFVIIIGGIYQGIFTSTEAAGVGAFGTFLIALIRRKLTWKNFLEALLSTATTTGFIFAIVLSSFILNYFLAITRIPMLLTDFLSGTELTALSIFLLIILMYLLLGAVMDSMAMIVITIPIVIPIMQAYDFNLIWFGIIMVIIVELALITPPVGMLCFVLDGITPEITLSQIYKGALLTVVPMFVFLILLYIFPEIVLFIPSLM
ncbi:Neu5Ac permease [Alkalihalophilus pseudofirmus]|nr:Neu5Ac permease [Alkalihalophilus pseudofirmus]